MVKEEMIKSIINEVYNGDYDKYFEEYYDDIKREIDRSLSFEDDEFYYFEIGDALYEDEKCNIGDSVKGCLLVYPCDKELTKEDYKELEFNITVFFCTLYMEKYSIILLFNEENFLEIDCRNGVYLY